MEALTCLNAIVPTKYELKFLTIFTICRLFLIVDFETYRFILPIPMIDVDLSIFQF